MVGRHAVEAEDKPPVDPHDSPMRIEGSPDEVYGAGQVMDWNQMPVAGQGYHVTPPTDETQSQLPVSPAAPAAPVADGGSDEVDWWNDASRGGTDADHHEDLFHGHADLQRQSFAPAVPPIPELDSGPSFNGFAPAQPTEPEPYEPFVPATAQVPEPPVFDEYQDLRPYSAVGEYEEQHHSGQFARQAVPPPPPEAPAPAEEEGRRIPLLLIAAIVGLVLVGVGVWTKWPRDVSQASPQQPGPTVSIGAVVPPPADGSNPLPLGPTDTPSADAPTTPGTAATTRKAPQPTPTTRRPPTSNPAPPPPPPPPPSESASPSPSPASPSPASPPA